jgi:phosphatidylglycerophosphate synthase/L-ascorbate metabolism protein UlaG (beta-lactamase superfamily)
VNLPNAITVGRIAITPLIAWLPLTTSWSTRLAAFGLFVAAAVSDYWDGYYARSRNLVTDLGRLLDPLADKLLLVATLVPMYWLQRHYTFIVPLEGVLPEPSPYLFVTPIARVALPLWIVLLVIGREVAMTVFRQVAARRGIVISAIGPAKWKTTFQSVWTGAAFFWFFAQSYAARHAWLDEPAFRAFAMFNGIVGVVTMTGAVVLTVWSLWLYLSRYGRRVLAAAVLVVTVGAAGPGTTRAGAQSATPSPSPSKATLRPGELRLTYLGNAGWEITDGTTVVLVDPFLTRFARWEPGARSDGPDPDALYEPDTARINRHVRRADYIVVTHGHSDHALDAGHIAARTGAVVPGRETIVNLARAYRVPEHQLITVLGGEDYDFDTFSVRVIPSIHSALDDKRYFSNGRGIAGAAPRGLTAPLRRRDHQEGGSVAYLVRMAGHEVLAMGSMNFIEREMEGLRPDVALVGANSQRLQIHDFTGRLLRALGHPAPVIPSHADGYGNPNPPPAALADRERFRQEVAASSPTSRDLYPTGFEPIVVPPRAPGASAAASAGASGAARRAVNPPGIAPLVPAYSVAVRDGEWVFVSGMTGVVPGTQEIICSARIPR